MKDQPFTPFEEPELHLLESTPENRRLTAGRVLDFMERAGMMDVLNNPVAKKKFFKEDITPEIAEEVLTRLNGIIIGQPIHEREIYEHGREVLNPENKEHVLLSPPRPDIQKDLLAREVIPTMKELSLSDAGKYAATQLVLLHMFPDGNGRLARLVELVMRPSTTMTSTESGIAQITNALSTNKGVVNWNPMHIQQELDMLILDTTLTKDPLARKIESMMATNFSVPDFTADELRAMSEDEIRILQAHALLNEVLNTNRLNGFIVLREFLFKKHGEGASDYLILKPGGKEEYVLNTQKLVAEMDFEDIAYIGSRLDMAKIMRIKLVSGIYLNPYEYSSPVAGMCLKDYYEREVIEFARKKS